MLIQKTNPVGIDKIIQLFQAYIHSSLTAKWNITDAYQCYARASRNQTDDGYIAEVLQAGTNSYAAVVFNSRHAAQSFFGTSTRSENVNGMFQTDVHLVFFVNLENLKPSITHRADEEVRKDVINACSSGLFGFELQEVETGLENVLREYPGSRRNEGLKFIDMQPIHCFRLNFSITYDINNC